MSSGRVLAPVARLRFSNEHADGLADIMIAEPRMLNVLSAVLMSLRTASVTSLTPHTADNICSVGTGGARDLRSSASKAGGGGRSAARLLGMLLTASVAFAGAASSLSRGSLSAQISGAIIEMVLRTSGVEAGTTIGGV